MRNPHQATHVVETRSTRDYIAVMSSLITEHNPVTIPKMAREEGSAHLQFLETSLTDMDTSGGITVAGK